jgi:DNA modification methylase
VVLDPFAGSGTLAVVCEHLNRRWICIELDEANCEISVKRIEAERKQPSLFELEQPSIQPPREGFKI